MSDWFGSATTIYCYCYILMQIYEIKSRRQLLWVSVIVASLSEY